MNIRTTALPWLALLVPLATPACRAPDTLAAPAASDAARLAALCEDAWQLALRCDPVQATYLGDAAHHGELVAPSPGNRARRLGELHELADRAAAISAPRLSPEDALTLEFARWYLATEVEALELDVDEPSWNVDPRSGPQVDFLSLALVQPASTPRERGQLLARWRAMPAYVDQCSANLERGLAGGRVASRTAIVRVLGQVDELLATPPEECALAEPARRDLPRDRDVVEWRRAVVAAVRDEIYPAFDRYRRTLRESVLPRARSDDRPGILFVAGGEAAYRAAIRRHTSLDLTPEAIHSIGLEEVARIRAETSELGLEVFGTRDLVEIQRRLRTEPALHFATRAEVESAARVALARAEAAVPRCFRRLPRTPCEVVRVPAHEERDTTIAYYREPALDGSRPGRYYVNTSEPLTRPRYDAEALAFHEAVPGHHTQIALAQELDGIPALRRHFGATAFVEGWALYTERLADELGLYSSDLDRLGMLSFDAWRASRLVVDTGLHALGWTRRQAIDYLVANTLLAENNAVNEVDRYIAWPGQALAYKLGQREVMRYRARAQAALGDRFDLAEFHQRVLENGALPLTLLSRRIDAWLRAPGTAR